MQTLNAKHRLKDLRLHLGFTQEQMANEFKVTTGAIAHWESGFRPLSGPVELLLDLYEEELGISSHPSNEYESIITSRMGRALQLSKIPAAVLTNWLLIVFKGIFLNQKNHSSVKKRASWAMLNKALKQLDKMKGLPMKLGQTLNYLDFATPSEAKSQLLDLHYEGQPLSQKKIAAVFKTELGVLPKQLFAKWSTRPIAAASIGQVHFARLETGENVAVKVQYPGISESIKSDLQNLKAFNGFLKLVIPEQESNSVVKELSDRLNEECDYLKEAQTQEFFRELFAHRPEIIIPRVYKEFSSSRILCSDYIDGQSLKEFVVTASAEDKNRAGEIIWKFTFESLFKHCVFNADPHPGNFLFYPGKVAFIDFGCTRRFIPNFVKNWKKLICAVIEGDKNKLVDFSVKLGSVRRTQNLDVDYYLAMTQQIYLPFLKNEEFLFDTVYMKKTFDLLFVKNPNRNHMRMTEEWIFLTRLIWGLSSTLSKMGAKSNWHRLIGPLLYDDSDGFVDLPQSMSNDFFIHCK